MTTTARTRSNGPRESGQDGGRFLKYYEAAADAFDNNTTRLVSCTIPLVILFRSLIVAASSKNREGPSMNPIATTYLGVPSFEVPDPPKELGQDGGKFYRAYDAIAEEVDNDMTQSLKEQLDGMPIFVNRGRQWLVYYRKRSGGGPDRQRWEQLKRFLGAKRWGLELILDDILPSLLQAGLIIFCISFSIYLNSLNSTLSTAVIVPLCLALAFLLGVQYVQYGTAFVPSKVLSHTSSGGF
ncbi:hypothetical protein FRC01_006729 [Tulasnella sp. 417]|nr:hypothetical protein FRC01_006729 [Tulasnella sp. 417]